MKLISLNIWGGEAYDPLMAFVAAHKSSTDIFCFQEVFTSTEHNLALQGTTRIHILEDLKSILSGFEALYFPLLQNFDRSGQVTFDLKEGKAIFFRKQIPVLASGEIITHRENVEIFGVEQFPSSFAFVRLPYGTGTLTVMNFHGVAFPGHKLDTPARLEQSRRMVEFITQEPGPIILCGDFNLMPNTESIAMIEPYLQNLIKIYTIQTTRSTISMYYGTPDEQRFADYTFCSPELHISKFKVPRDAKVSDHLPMILEFE